MATKLRTYVAGSAFGPADANAVQDDYEPAFGVWQDITELRRVRYAAGTSSASQLATGVGVASVAIPSASVLAAWTVFYINGADYPGGGRTTRMRIRAGAKYGAGNGAIQFTVSLNPVATWGGASGAGSIVNSISAATASTVAMTLSSTSLEKFQTSAAFSPPTAGWFVLTSTFIGTPVVTGEAIVQAYLQVRNA